MSVTNATQINETIDALNELIVTCKNGENVFAAAAEKTTESPLRTLFAGYSEQRRQYAEELQAAAMELGAEPVKPEHLTGSLQRGWMSLKGALTGDIDNTIIDESEAGEDAAMRSYREALAKVLLPSARALIRAQLQGIQAAHGVVRDLKHNRASSQSGGLRDKSPGVSPQISA